MGRRLPQASRLVAARPGLAWTAQSGPGVPGRGPCTTWELITKHPLVCLVLLKSSPQPERLPSAHGI